MGRSLSRRRTFITGAIAAIVTGIAVEAAAAPGDPKTKLVSRQSQAAGGLGADDVARNPSISGNGRYVAFETEADNLGGPLDTGVTNIYVYDRKKRRAILVSRRSKGGPGADGSSFSPEISANGRLVVYSTFAENLGGPESAPAQENVYAYDLKKRRTQLISRRSGKQGAAADSHSYGGFPSATGRFVTFTTVATNLGGRLHPAVTNLEKVYLYDRKSKRVHLISRRSGKNGISADSYSNTSSVSKSGRFVAFASDGTNLSGATHPAALTNVYVYDRKRRRVALISRRPGKGAGADANSTDPFIAANGRFVGFESEATNLPGPYALSDPFDSNIYVRDRKRDTVQLVSRQSAADGGGAANDSSDDPVLSANGRFVVFESEATNLAAADPGSNDDAFLYDRKRRRVVLVGRATNGDPCDDECEDPFISASGRFVAFEASAANLGGPVDASHDNIYVRDRGR